MVLPNSCNVRKNVLITSASLFLMGVLSSNSQAKAIQAQSCSLSDVQLVVNAAEQGDTISLPSGSSSWSGSLKIATRNLTLMGKGIGVTVISGGSKSISLSGESANNLRITGLEFRAGSQVIYAAGSGSPRQAVKNLRVDHCKFLNVFLAIETKGGCTGVFDHCEFVNSYGARLYGSNDPGPRAPYALGTEDALFFEDNSIVVTSAGSPAHFIASNSFSKYVIRYNNFDYQKSLWDIIDAHGACEVIGRGSATWEIYNNTIKLVPSISRVIHLRGGQGVVFNNTFTGDYTPSKAITITDYAVCNGPCSQSCTTYPCPDMINHAYFWNNKIRTTSVDPVNSCDHFIKVNRDYFLTPMPGYTPYTYPHPLTKSTSGTVSTKKKLSESRLAPGALTITSMEKTASTLISYNLEKNTPVKIAVFSVNGTRVSLLVNETQSAGSHSVTWNASSSPKGLYIIRTSIDGVMQNFKIAH